VVLIDDERIVCNKTVARLFAANDVGKVSFAYTTA